MAFFKLLETTDDIMNAVEGLPEAAMDLPEPDGDDERKEDDDEP